MKPQGKVTIFMLVMIVMLSVYYFAISNGEKPIVDDNPTVDVVKSEEFEQLREQVAGARQQMIAVFQGVLSNSEVSVEDKNTALESITKIQNISLNEGLLETKLCVDLGYNDAFVQHNADTNTIEVSIYTNNLTQTDINSIILATKNQFGTGMKVHVSLSPINGEDTLN